MDDSENHCPQNSVPAVREVRFAEVFSPDRIQIGVEISSTKRMLEAVSQLIVTNINGAVTEDTVFRTLLERERLGSTCVGNGVALPHCRLDDINKPVGAIIRMEKPLEMDAIDEAPVDLICALVVPSDAVSEHIEILRTLAEGIERFNLHHRIRNAQSNAEVYLQLTELDNRQ